MSKGLIITNDYLSLQSIDYCTDRLQAAAERKGVGISVFGGSKAAAEFDSIISYMPDFVIMRDKFPVLAKAFEYRGIPVFNSSDTIRICDDKAEMSVTLEGRGVLRPLTLISPQTYGNKIGEDFIRQVADRIQFPVIVKKTRSSYGMGVFKADNYSELKKFANFTESIVFEEYIPYPFGQDIRVFVVGDKITGAMRRKGRKGDFRSNIELGGTAEKVAIDENIKELAFAAIKAVGADYGGVDIIDCAEPVVIEVNASAGFREMDRANNTDTAAYIIDYIMEKIR